MLFAAILVNVQFEALSTMYWGAAFGMHTSHKIIVTVITGPMNIPQIYTV